MRTDINFQVALTDRDEFRKYLDYVLRFIIKENNTSEKMYNLGIDFSGLTDDYIDMVWNSLKLILNNDSLDWMAWYAYELDEKEQDYNYELDKIHKESSISKITEPLFTNYTEFLDMVIDLSLVRDEVANKVTKQEEHICQDEQEVTQKSKEDILDTLIKEINQIKKSIDYNNQCKCSSDMSDNSEKCCNVIYTRQK